MKINSIAALSLKELGMSDKAPSSAITTFTTEQLRTMRETVATELYNLFCPICPLAPTGSPEHEQLERRFNEIEKELLAREHEARGKPREDFKYIYKHDVRYHFHFYQTKVQNGIVEQIAEMKGKPGGRGNYPLLPEDQVINWRSSTKIGKQKHEELRERLKREKLDDAGHLIAVSLGTDPGDIRNVAAQNFLQNQVNGSWNQAEKELKEALKSNRYRDVSLRVTVKYKVDTGEFRVFPWGRRSYEWKMDALGIEASSGKPIIWRDGTVSYLNTVYKADSRAKGYQIAKGVRENSRNAVFPETRTLRLVRSK